MMTEAIERPPDRTGRLVTQIVMIPQDEKEHGFDR